MWIGAGHRRDAVFGDHDDPGAVALGRRDQLARERVDLLEVLLEARLAEIGTEPLQVVVEVRQVAEASASGFLVSRT